MLYFIGSTFPAGAAWYADEIATIVAIQQQIDNKFSDGRNLLINTTWFGPQFDNGQYDKFLQLVKDNQTFDRVFLLAAVDPVFLNHDQVNNLAELVHAKETYLLGHFDTKYQFNFHAVVVAKYFAEYKEQDLLPTDLCNIFINYNRKPRDHRVQLINKLIENNLDQAGVITLGTDNSGVFNKEEQHPGHLVVKDFDAHGAKDSMGNDTGSKQFGIPDDIHSVGNLSLWQQHFLNIVSETEFLPWDNTFVSEKTWKPILGMRPFVINGQAKIYAWLRDRGFRTFNHYFGDIELENRNELEVHDSIVSVVKYLQKFSKQDLHNLYDSMLPDLQHNRQRFFEFAQEQQHKINNLL